MSEIHEEAKREYPVSQSGAEASAPPPEALPRRFFVRMPERQPYAVWGLLIVTIGVFLLQMLTQSGALDLGNCPYFFSPDLPACYGLKVNEFIVRGQYWRLLAPILLHGSLLHVGFNMYALYVLGPELERHLGHASFLALYVISGFAGFVVSFLLTPAASLGASTAVFGLLAAQAVFIYRNQHIFGERARLALRNILNIAVINFVIGLSPGIDNWGHLGGFLGGALFAWLAAPDYRVVGEGPQFDLDDQMPAGRYVVAGLATAIVFGALAAVRIWGAASA
ncbi:MAG: rhomboid family intramembrane serine protease [Chloroflexi bacterium]|nr:rhomboid family intramembrane serine protease [Chloroflexota bacterium]